MVFAYASAGPLRLFDFFGYEDQDLRLYLGQRFAS
jgi:hypothetical protein